jgi:hypothetical protein
MEMIVSWCKRRSSRHPSAAAACSTMPLDFRPASLHPIVKHERKAETQIRLSDLHETLLSRTQNNQT